MQVYTIGRQNSTIPPDIEIPRQEDTVGRFHLELTCSAGDRYLVVDQKTVNHTYQMDSGVWVKISEAYIGVDTPIKLGSYQTTVRALLEMHTPRQLDEEVLTPLQEDEVVVQPEDDSKPDENDDEDVQIDSLESSRYRWESGGVRTDPKSQ